jgi:phospholipid/cholesterol/gamma-HCH transport system permease protein
MFRKKLQSPYAVKAGSVFNGIGGLVGLSLDVVMALIKPPFPWEEFLNQTWFAAKVCIVPATLLAVPYSIISAFGWYRLFGEFGAGDFGGAGTAIFTVNQIAPLATIVVVSGAAATAMTADVGARTIREEIDALRTMGIDPVRALALPRALALSLVACLVTSFTAVLGMICGYVTAIYGEHASPGPFVYGMTLLTGLGDVIGSAIKGLAFGFVCGLIASYKGLNVRGGPVGVGIAVAEACVFCFVASFTVNLVMTAVLIQFTLH